MKHSKGPQDIVLYCDYITLQSTWALYLALQLGAEDSKYAEFFN